MGIRSGRIRSATSTCTRRAQDRPAPTEDWNTPAFCRGEAVGCAALGETLTARPEQRRDQRRRWPPLAEGSRRRPPCHCRGARATYGARCPRCVRHPGDRPPPPWLDPTGRGHTRHPAHPGVAVVDGHRTVDAPAPAAITVLDLPRDQTLRRHATTRPKSETRPRAGTFVSAPARSRTWIYRLGGGRLIHWTTRARPLGTAEDAGKATGAGAPGRAAAAPSAASALERLADPGGG